MSVLLICYVLLKLVSQKVKLATEEIQKDDQYMMSKPEHQKTGRSSVPIITTENHRKIFRNTSLPPPIIEVTVEDDNSSNSLEQLPECPLPTINYEKETVDKGKRKHSNKLVDPRTRNNSYVSESSQSVQLNKENGNNLSIQNGNFTRNGSIGNSIRSSTRCSSVQSLSVIREQYCCFAKWTPCERILGATVGTMAIVIVILIVVIGILSSNTKSNFSGLTMSL